MRMIFVAAFLAGPALGQVVAPAASPPMPPPAPYAAPDYRQDGNWLCRPGRSDACSADISITSVAANGTGSVATPKAPKAVPGIDCFYVYPTVSTQPTPNSDLVVGAAETNVARVQFAPFRNVCRTFAPMYRQITLKALRDELFGLPSRADRLMAYRDVAAAWSDYLARDNNGRGVILIGHSQGSNVLRALIQREIEGKPIADRIVAAYIPGSNVLVPAGKDVGGDFKSTPLCRAAGQTGCVVAWVSFRDGMTPPADSLFGRTAAPGMTVACANPAALGGGRAVLKPLLPNRIAINETGAVASKWAKGLEVATPFVALPGLLSGECQTISGASVLSIRTEADPADPRTDDVGGDIVYNGQPIAAWGLHLIDVNAVLGDLVDLAAAQGKAWAAKRR